MKKLLALFLLLAMLIPMCIVAQAEEVADKPFYLVNMSNVDYADVKNTYAMRIYYGFPVDKENPELKTHDGLDIPEKAAALKNYMENLPEGTRYFLLEPLRRAFNDLSDDFLFLEDGVALVKQWLDDFLKEYKRIDGPLDGLIIDLEYEIAYSWFLFERGYSKNQFVYYEIVQNPKYQTILRPKLVERGFKFYEKISDLTPEIYSIQPNAGDEYASSRNIWDAVVRDMANEYVNQACEPLFTYYPDAVLTDYQSKNTYGWLKDNELDGGLSNGAGNINHTVGNRSSEDAYNVRPSTGFFKTLRNMNNYNNAVYENTPFNCFMADANTFKVTSAAAKDGKCSYWITDWRYNTTNPNSVSKTPYYSEVIIHLAMLDPDPLCGYIIPSEIVGVSNAEDPDYTHAVEIADDIMVEMTRLMGKADRKPIPTSIDWNSKFIVSGMYAGGKNYWRLTPDTSVVSLENFKVEGADPTFSAAGKTITFPGGKIIEDGNVREVGTCGYWIETAADVSPVITVTDNYYYQYPAFAENFDTYESGADFDAATAKPTGAWQIKKSSKSGGYIKNGALALKGKFSITNTTVPGFINAVDTYAKHQAWEVDVTVPADMAADAEIVLFNCVGQKPKSDDVGVKIAGGKVYYDNAGEYVELTDVTLGSTYKVVRELDMTVAEAFTSDYYIYDATGALVDSALDIPMTSLVAPITTISLGCENIVGEPVLLDNYRLYITDANTNFELYDVGNGIKQSDLTVKRDKDTAYRLTWVNATQEEQSYSVVAAYYNGDSLVSEQVVKEIKVAPNTDGVETGIVNIETAGQTLLVYLKDHNSAKGGGSNAGFMGGAQIYWVLIIVAVVAMVIMNVSIYMIVQLGKKQNQKRISK